MAKKIILSRIVTRKLYLLILLVVIFAVVGGFGFRVYQNRHQKNLSNVENIKLREDKRSAYNKQLLVKKDYHQYQIETTVTADTYMNNPGGLPEAEKLLKKVINVVPEDSIEAITYQSLSSLYKQKNDNVDYFKYTELTIKRLKKEGNADLAKLYEEQLLKDRAATE